MKDNFPKSLAVILKSEGGYVNDPHDPGGETNMGISKRAYPKLDIKSLTKEDVAAIYRKDYWDAVKCDQLPSGLDLVVFDSAVNSGVKQASKWLQKALGVTADGALGPITMKALEEANKGVLVDKYLDARLAFLQSLTTWPRYKNGWATRLHELAAIAHSMK